MGTELYTVMDRLIQLCPGRHEPSVVAKARAVYDKARGRVFEDETLWEGATKAFLEWYILEYVPEGAEVPAAATVRDREAAGTTRDMMTAWLTSVRGLFELCERGTGWFVVRDWLGNAEYEISESRVMHGMDKGDVVEARLVALDGTVHFGRTFVFHPRVTNDALARRVREWAEAGHSRADILDRASSLRIKCERYSHVAPAKVYAGVIR